MASLGPLANRIPHHDNLVEEQTPDPIIMVSTDQLLTFSLDLQLYLRAINYFFGRDITHL
jgi:hypothetical protein